MNAMQRKTYIVDVDGTLADLTHRLHFIQGPTKEWDKFFDACVDDAPIRDVIDVVRTLGLCQLGSDPLPEIIYLTGRPERVRRETQIWMSQYFLPTGRLIMRRDGDHRPDTQAKRELMEDILAEGGRIAGVFEDRVSVVKLWREMGLTVFQLNHEEF